MSFHDGPHLCPFARLRVALAHQLFRWEPRLDKGPLKWSEKLVGGASASVFDGDDGSILMSVSSNGQKVIRQTKRTFLYRAKQGQVVTYTYQMPQQDGVICRAGLFNDSDGLFLEVTDDDMAWVTRSSVGGSVANRKASRAAGDWWIDKFDGYGESGIEYDPLNTNQAHLDLQYLGSGRARFGLGYGGREYESYHSFNANVRPSSFMRTGSLPFRFEIESTGGSGSMKAICVSVEREGGTAEPGIPASADTSIITPVNCTTTLRSLLAVRLKTGYKTAYLRPTGFNIFPIDNGPFKGYLLLNPTLDGTLSGWTDTGATAEQSTTQLAVTAMGHKMGSTPAGATGGPIGSPGVPVPVDSEIGVSADIDEVSDILVLAGETSAITAQDCMGFIYFNEEY